MKPFEYRLSFDDDKAAICSLVLEWGRHGFDSDLNIDQFETMVAIKGTDRSINRENLAFRKYVAFGKSVEEKTFDHFVIPNLSDTFQKTDGLILDGVSTLEFEHLGVWECGRPCMMISYKRCLAELNSSHYKILLLTRVIDYLGSEVNASRQSFSELLTLLQKLDVTDQKICRGLASGDSTKDIANSVGLTTRSIELRRQKMMELFGFQRPIEIVKMLVRLQENGLINNWC